MKKIALILFFSLIFFSVGGNYALAVVDIGLISDDSAVDVSTPFNVTVNMSGNDAVGAVSLTINFDNQFVEVTNVSSNIDGVVVPNDLAPVNAEGQLIIGYASTTGFDVLETGILFATISCMSKNISGTANFTIDSSSNIKSNVFPPTDITGDFTHLLIAITGNDMGGHLPAIDLDNWGAVNYVTSEYQFVDFFVRVIDHDGISEDGSSHAVTVTDPQGNVYALGLDYGGGGTSAYYANYYPDAPKPPVYEGDYTFAVTDPDGNTATVVDTLVVNTLPPLNTASFTPRGNQTTADTSPTLNWDPVEGALHYRVRIHDAVTESTVHRGYTGETTYTVPPGILSPNTQYAYRIDARDAHFSFDIDNNFRSPAYFEDFIRFTTGPEAASPFIEPDQYATTWTDSIIGTFTNFWIKIHDAQGVPGNIASVKVVSPNGSEIPLYYDIGNTGNNETKGIYRNDYFAIPPESGDYTFIATDINGNQYTVSDNMAASPMPVPDRKTALPAQDTVLTGTGVDFDWADVAGSAFYQLEIYDSDFSRIYRFATLESAFSLPSGYLKPGSLYRYRIKPYDKFFEQNTDNASAMESYRFLTPTFFTSGGRTGGTSEPIIDLGDMGVFINKFNRPGTNTPKYARSFYIIVEDADGVPENIQSVTATLPDGTTRNLRCEDKISDTRRYYFYADYQDSMDGFQDGEHTFTVTDFDGNETQATEDLSINELPIPTGLVPDNDGAVFTTTPSIDWDDVPGAQSYRVRIYDGWDGSVHNSDYLSVSVYTVPPGVLEDGKVYSYRIDAHREAAPDASIDNRSISHAYYGNRIHFTVRSGDNAPPSAPTPSSPANESIAPDGNVVLQTTDFTDPENDAHLATQWTVRRADMPYNRDGYAPSFTFKAEGEHLTEHPLENLIPGMKYVWKAAFVDGYGDASPESRETAFKVGTSAMRSVSVLHGGVAADFEMISFVQWPDDPSESAVIGDDIGTYDTTLYRIGTYDPTIGGYVEYGHDMGIQPGRAYWIFTRNDLNISVDGVPVTLTHDVEVPLAYNADTLDGWNMIAPPNDRLYDWGDVKIVVYDGNGGIVYGPVAIAELNDSNPYIDKRLWMWENGAYSPDAQDLFPNHGYWVRAFRENVSLRFPGAENGRTVKARSAERMARAVEKAGQWLGDRIPGPRSAIADVGDAPPAPAPIGGFTGEPTDGSSGSGGAGGCFIMTAGDSPNI